MSLCLQYSTTLNTMTYERVITVQLADGETLEYSSTMRYTDGYVFCSKIKDFIREKTGRNNFDLYDEEGINLNAFEMVYALLIACVFKPDKCTSCGDDGVLLSDIGDLCFNCWELKNTDETLCIGLSDGPKTYKTMNMMWDYKVYFNETTNKQRFIELIDKGNNVLQTITDDVLMYSRLCYGLVLKSKIPEQFLDRFEEVEKFWTPHMDFDDDDSTTSSPRCATILPDNHPSPRRLF